MARAVKRPLVDDGESGKAAASGVTMMSSGKVTAGGRHERSDRAVSDRWRKDVRRKEERGDRAVSDRWRKDVRRKEDEGDCCSGHITALLRHLFFPEILRGPPDRSRRRIAPRPPTGTPRVSPQLSACRSMEEFPMRMEITNGLRNEKVTT